MNDSEIYHQAVQTADDATAAKYGSVGTHPSLHTAAGDYWTLVFQATAAAIFKRMNNED